MEQSTENSVALACTNCYDDNNNNFVPIEYHDRSTHSHHGRASVTQTIINMAKTCAGTGCLALPFAASQGGILLHCFGLLIVGVWNVITVQRLCQCYDLVMGDPSSIDTTAATDDKSLRQGEMSILLQSNNSSCNSTVTDDSRPSYNSTQQADDAVEGGCTAGRSMNDNIHIEEHPPKGTTTLVKLAWYALGRVGANVLDVVMVAYLLGVILTYVNAMRSFLADTRFTTGLGFVDSFILVAIMGPLSVVPHTGHLAQASAMGLLVLLATFLVIAWYGFVVGPDSVADGEQNNNWHVLTGDNLSALTTTTIPSVHPPATSLWFPKNGLAGASQWFGCVVFGFGIAPLTFSFREAMHEPRRLVPSTWMAMALVSVSYIVIGVGLLYPFPDIKGDVLHELPTTGWLPTATRLAMMLVVLVTAPLLIVPCGELLEGKLAGWSFHHETESSDYDHATQQPHKSWRLKALVRWSLCLVCAAISCFVPGFVNVLSFVGCCCVAVVGFCLPPFLHIILSVKKNARHLPTSRSRIQILMEQLMDPSLWMDVALLVWGLLATAISTYYTFREISSS